MKDSFISAHLVQSASYSANGNFIYATEQEMIDKMEEMATIYSNLHESIRTSETGVYLGVCLFNTNKAMEELCVYYGVN